MAGVSADGAFAVFSSGLRVLGVSADRTLAVLGWLHPEALWASVHADLSGLGFAGSAETIVVALVLLQTLQPYACSPLSLLSS